MGNGTSIGKVRGLGSAHSGAHHWLLQRFTAIGLLLLGLFFLAAFLQLPNFDYKTVRDWIVQPLPATAAALFVVCAFWHARLGLEVLIEDYIHVPGNTFAVKALLNLATFGGAAFGLFAVIRLALGAAA